MLILQIQISQLPWTWNVKSRRKMGDVSTIMASNLVYELNLININ